MCFCLARVIVIGTRDYLKCKAVVQSCTLFKLHGIRKGRTSIEDNERYILSKSSDRTPKNLQ